MTMEPFAVNGRVDVEQLDALLSCQTEYPSLDYKQSCELARGTKGRAEFVKDAAAMMSRPSGGYLVVGVDGRGERIGVELSEKTFDSASLKDILAKYLEGDIPVASQVHHHEEGDVAVIYLGHRIDGLFPIVKSDVTYLDTDGNQRVHLREGDVYVRDGTSSRRWRSGDLAQLLQPYVALIRGEEQSTIKEVIDQIGRQQRGMTLANSAIGTLTWRLPRDEFNAAVMELSRADDDKALRVLHLGMRADGIKLAASAVATDDVNSTGFADLIDFLDCAAGMAGIGIMLGDRALLEASTQTLHSFYVSVGHEGHPISPTAPRIWLEIAARVLGCMALAVRLAEWDSIAPLALRPIGTTYVFRSWLRHADVYATRTNQSASLTPEHKTMTGLLVAYARQCVVRIPALRPDVPEDQVPILGEPTDSSDTVLDSICQADFLWCVIASGGGRGLSEQYPSFAFLYDHRTKPIIAKLRTDDDMAESLLPGRSRDDVHELADAVISSAVSEGHFWD